MPKAEWGVKRTCASCDTRFYDLRREPILCPECGATFDVGSQAKVSPARERRMPVPVPKAADPLVDEEDLAEEAEEEADDPLLGADDEDEEPAGPALAEEQVEDEAVAFQDPVLIDDEADESAEADDEEDEEDDLDDLDDVAVEEKGV